ncbi:hypothetical protein O4H49_04360 [Kiloniella laminariae]|uniref:Uncharacterized protein n=1 Tax=Kiloniella laminariae TaxID=454162 RepID=A0ABT4LFW2_9PROT|nr:hypothetical protein [Kiloniella laminariae]MCZ4279998.1 hypothetical protein [Kiloniella laminariae]
MAKGAYDGSGGWSGDGGSNPGNEDKSPGDNRPEDRMSKAGNGTWGTASKQASSVSDEQIRAMREKHRKPGFNPTPSPPSNYTGTWGEWTERYNRANRLGRYSNALNEPLDVEDQRALSKMISPKHKPGTPEYNKAVAARNVRAQSIAAYNHPIRSGFHNFLSSLLPGVSGKLTYDTYGNLATEKRFNVPDFVASLPSPRFMGFGMSTPAGIAAKAAVAAAGLAGYRSKDFVDIQSMSDALDEMSITPERSSDNSSSTRSIAKRPEDILYPYTVEDENLPAGQGVSFGATPVRRAPVLTALNRRRAAYGRG